MAVVEQALMFASAEMVVGSHGAGFSNLVFSPAGTGVLEFEVREDFSPSYEILASHRGLRYRRIKCRSVVPGINDLRVEVADMMAAVRSLVQQIGDGRSGEGRSPGPA